MKKFASAASIALALFSGAALAEQGSAQLNQIEQPTSSIDYHASDVNMAPADLTALNGDNAKNQVLKASMKGDEHTVSRYAPADLTSVNS